MKNLVAIIVGGTGQFGIITSEFLLKKNYKVIFMGDPKQLPAVGSKELSPVFTNPGFHKQQLTEVYRTQGKILEFDSGVRASVNFRKPGIVNSKELADTASTIPIEKLLVETDSPYLAPLPYRGKPNEPSYIVHTIDKLSQVKNVSKTAVIDHTTNNFKKLFNLS